MMARRRSVSIRGASYDRLRTWCAEHNCSMSDVFEKRIAELEPATPDAPVLDVRQQTDIRSGRDLSPAKSTAPTGIYTDSKSNPLSDDARRLHMLAVQPRLTSQQERAVVRSVGKTLDRFAPEPVPRNMCGPIPVAVVEVEREPSEPSAMFGTRMKPPNPKRGPDLLPYGHGRNAGGFGIGMPGRAGKPLEDVEGNAVHRARLAALKARPPRSIEPSQHVAERGAPTKLRADPPRDARAICAPRPDNEWRRP